MAPFNPGLAQTNDPSYFPARGQPSGPGLSMPRQLTAPPADTSLGKLFEGIGNDISAGARGLDQAIQQNIKNDAFENVDPVRASAGANLTPEETIAIAGTGARGARFANAVGTSAVDDIAKDDATLPAGAEKNVKGLARIQQAYQSGQLSDTHYYAMLENISKDLNARYPGYREQVDATISSITGVNPANALRKSVLTDMNSMAAANNAQNNKIATTFREDAKYIQSLYPGMDVNAYAANKNSVDVEVGKLKARDYAIDSEEKGLSLMDKRDSRSATVAGQVYTNRINSYIDTTVRAAINGLQSQSETLLGKGANASPEETQALANKYQALRSTIQQNAQILYTRPIDDKGNSISTYLKPEEFKARTEAALADLDVVAKNLGVDPAHTGVAMAAANILKHRSTTDMVKMEDKFPVSRGLKAATDLFGPQAGATLLQSTTALPELSKAITTNAWANIGDKTSTAEPQSVSDALNAHGANINGKIATVTVKGIQQMADPTKFDPEVAARAVHSLYADPKFFANVDTKDKEVIYKSLTNPDFTEKMAQLGKSNPAAWSEYSQWVVNNTPAVYKQAMDNLQQASTYDRYNVVFDPKSSHFTATTKPEFAPRTLSGNPMPDNAQNYVNGINELADRVMPVLKKQYGDQAPQKFVEMIGYDPNAQKTGTWAQGLGSAIQKAYGLVDDYLNKGNRPLAPGESPTMPSMSRPQGKQSSNDINDTVVKVASQYVGMDETNNRTVLSSFMTKAAGRKVDPQTEAWCADFANAVLDEAGGQGTGSAMARSFLKYGTETTAPKTGDVVVLSRGAKDGPLGHVGFFQGYETHDGQKYVRVLAGNTNNSVTTAEYPVSRVLGYRAVKAKDIKQWKFDTANLDDTGNPPARRG